MTAAASITPVHVTDLKARVGQQVGLSGWHLVDQPKIDAFAAVTGDHQFIHVDPVRAAETRFGGTIAHGLLTLSLLPVMSLEALPEIEGTVMGLNYGFDRVRFLSPVRVGDRIRAGFVLDELTQAKPDELNLIWQITVEIEGGKRPALAASWLNRFYLAPADTNP